MAGIASSSAVTFPRSSMPGPSRGQAVD